MTEEANRREDELEGETLHRFHAGPPHSLRDGPGVLKYLLVADDGRLFENA